MGFSNRFSGAFLGRSASSLPLTNGETEVHRCTVIRLTAADGPVAELVLSGAPKSPVVIPCFEIHPDAGGLMCHNVLAQKQVAVWSQQLLAAMRVHKLRTRRGPFCVWVALFLALWLFYIPSPGESIWKSVSSWLPAPKRLASPRAPGSGALPCGSSSGHGGPGMGFDSLAGEEKRLEAWKCKIGRRSSGFYSGLSP